MNSRKMSASCSFNFDDDSVYEKSIQSGSKGMLQQLELLVDGYTNSPGTTLLQKRLHFIDTLRYKFKMRLSTCVISIDCFENPTEIVV
uniref:Uncharacterized protein n=1 Tax=Candidatus Kentrum sp. TC TaxID=2126339 RepID=A0A450YV89_9GAMM|nr:MAG: hypothetical protein BECKTC1821E_GA0114239_10499 [Candidatus Kentron sp. TC]